MSIKITEQSKQKAEIIINAVSYARQQAGVTFQNQLFLTGEGLFDILVMSRFMNGKSTFINTLVGKELMSVRATACTAVISTVEYGCDTNNVKVVYSDSSKTKTMPLRQFEDEFTLSAEDQQYIDDGGYLDRFANVSHVEMQSTDEIFTDGVRLIDSPALEETTSRIKVTNEFLPKANAVIFILSATRLFSAAEKEYIAENFAGKNMRNVFFVVNRIDNLTPGQLELSVKPGVREGLQDVFTDSNGVFDEELYNKRVFFTNAYGALCARTGEPYKIIIGRKEVAVDIDLEDTGILEFEAALNEFLNSYERFDAIGEAVLKSMAHCYCSATANYEKNMSARFLPICQLEQNLNIAIRKLDSLREKAYHMRTISNGCGHHLGEKIYYDLLYYVHHELSQSYHSLVANGLDGAILPQIVLHIALNPLNITPLAEKISFSIKNELQKWSNRIPTLIEQELADLANETFEFVDVFDLGLNNAKDVFSSNANIAEMPNGARRSTMLLDAIALYKSDIGTMSETTSNGNLKLSAFIEQLMSSVRYSLERTSPINEIDFVSMITTMATNLLHNGLIWNGQNGNHAFLIRLGSMVFAKLESIIKDHEITIRDNLRDSLVKEMDVVVSNAYRLIDETEENFHMIISEAKYGNDESAAYRQQKAIDDFRHHLNDVYCMFNGRYLADEDIETLVL